MAKRRFIENIKERLAKEVGTVYKPHAGRLRFALAFPNSYYVGMSNLGLQTVYRILNEREDSVCERVFLPDPSDADELLRTGISAIVDELMYGQKAKSHRNLYITVGVAALTGVAAAVYFLLPKDNKDQGKITIKIPVPQN